MTRLLDITVPLGAGLPAWPGEPHARITRISDMAKGDSCTVSTLEMVVHCGTHLDAPIHFVAGGGGVDSLDLDLLMGPCWVAHAADTVSILTPETLEALAVPPGTRRLLIRTRNSLLWERPDHAFVEDFVAFSAEGARWIVDRGIRLVGVDYLSVEPFAHAEPVVHRTLLAAGVVAVEGLDLRFTEAGAWDLICLPLLIPGCDGAPVRAVLRRPNAPTGGIP